MGLATLDFLKWQVPWDLPLSRVSRLAETGSYGEWQVPRTCHFLIQEVASPVGLATLDFMKWQVPWDLPLLNSRSGKSHGTCHFLRVSTPAETASYGEWQVQWDLPLFDFRSGKSHGTCHFLMQEDFMKWQVPWDLPLLNSRSGKSRDLPLLML